MIVANIHAYILFIYFFRVARRIVGGLNHAVERPGGRIGKFGFCGGNLLGDARFGAPVLAAHDDIIPFSKSLEIAKSMPAKGYIPLALTKANRVKRRARKTKSAEAIGAQLNQRRAI